MSGEGVHYVEGRNENTTTTKKNSKKGGLSGACERNTTTSMCAPQPTRPHACPS